MKETSGWPLIFVFSFVLFMMFLPSIITRIEKIIYYRFGKINFIHFYLIRKKLSNSEKRFLEKEVSFYRKLDRSKKRSFDHRIASFLKKRRFHSRGKLLVTREMELLIAASAIKLTFGFRNFNFSILETIIVYPNKYTSTKTKRIHKGEFNPRLKTLVFSWEDFLLGNEIEDDNLNLGIHEFTHVVHINSQKQKDLSSIIFKKEFKSLKAMIQNDARIKNKLITSDYFRKYAFENHYEFIAVLIESFIETPEEFKSEFPKIYNKIKTMLNFNFLDY
jgi:Mlc titration factor MtfA (ptsG expression regulator)